MSALDKKVKIDIQGPFYGRSSVCKPILLSLPEWFGIEEANRQYLEDIERLPTYLAELNGRIVGFMTIKEHNEFSAEIHIIGVCPELHRKGIGHALHLAVEKDLKEREFEYLQVKTLSSSHPDVNYSKTRAFYFSMGFRPLEEFKLLWGEANPCLQMIKALS
jgi:ribosomal protein S18 acetylase RimI-like enzyme